MEEKGIDKTAVDQARIADPPLAKELSPGKKNGTENLKGSDETNERTRGRATMMTSARETGKNSETVKKIPYIAIK